MVETTLKSYDFRREREQTWRELDVLVGRANKGGLTALSPEELLRLPALYRATLSALSVARGISLDQNVLAYLESLAMRAYFCVYGAREGLFAGLWRFFAHDFPAAVRVAAWPLLLATAILILGIIVGHILTVGNPDWYYSFVSEGLAGGRAPTSTTAELRSVLYSGSDEILESLNLFASFLFTHNAKIGMLCFALGFAFGVPTAIFLFQTGLMIGGFSGLYATRDMAIELWAWLLIHGTTELLAIILCGGSGFVLASALIFPTQHSRMHNLTLYGRRAARIVIGAVALFFVAALLEGFGRQIITDITLRYLIGSGMLLWWLLYFLQAGKRAHHDRN
ncbi:MAG: stage II sporulation protein M [Alphaproteobacteria bacterium]|nr:stage II sporulation protein M [Alphaproteobacteria bacterium]